MTRLKISIAILLALIGLSIGSACMVRKQCETLLTNLQQVEQADSTAEAEQCEQFLQAWNRSRNLLVYLVRKDRLAEVEASIIRLQPLAEEECDEFTAELKTVDVLLNRLMQAEALLLPNVF